MPVSKKPRRKYTGPRSGRDFDAMMRSSEPLRLDPTPPKVTASPAPSKAKVATVRTRPAARGLSRNAKIGIGIGAGAAVTGGAAYALHRRRSRTRKSDEMILIDPFTGDYLQVEKSYAIGKVDILPGKSSRVAPRHRTSPNMGDGQRVRRWKAKGRPQGRVFVYHGKGQSAVGIGKRLDGRVPNTGGAATVSFRGGPLSELGRHNRVGQRIPR